MKLRLHGNTLRLRLSQPEVAQLAADGKVEDTVRFQPGEELVYTLESATQEHVGASFQHGRISVTLPASKVSAWAASDLTGIEGSSGGLQVAVEKDFQCLHQAAEPNVDAFPNPLADKF